MDIMVLVVAIGHHREVGTINVVGNTSKRNVAVGAATDECPRSEYCSYIFVVCVLSQRTHVNIIFSRANTGFQFSWGLFVSTKYVSIAALCISIGFPSARPTAFTLFINIFFTRRTCHSPTTYFVPGGFLLLQVWSP